jgi:protein TonB
VLTLSAVTGHSAAQQPPEAAQTGAQDLLLPNVTRFVEPAYQSIAESARVSGTVILGVTVDAKGRLQDARVARSVPLLDEAALDAVRRWQFAPPVVDGTPVPTGFNVTVEFVLSAGESVPTPSVPGPQPMWLPDDFAFSYSFICHSGSRVDIDMRRGYSHAPYLGSPGGAPLDWTVDEIGSIYLRTFAAGAFVEGDELWRPDPDPGLHTVEDGFRVQVLRISRIAFVRRSDGPPVALPHILDLRHYGVWRRVEWGDPDYDGRPEPQDQLATVGALIRRIAAEKPAVSELPPERRACLED